MSRWCGQLSGLRLHYGSNCSNWIWILLSWLESRCHALDSVQLDLPSKGNLIPYNARSSLLQSVPFNLNPYFVTNSSFSLSQSMPWGSIFMENPSETSHYKTVSFPLTANRYFWRLTNDYFLALLLYLVFWQMIGKKVTHSIFMMYAS